MTPHRSIQLYTHAARRFAARHGVVLDRAFHREMIRMIQNNEGEFVCRSSNSRTVWRLATSKGKFCVVYSSSRKRIVTVFPSWKWKAPRRAS